MIRPAWESPRFRLFGTRSSKVTPIYPPKFGCARHDAGTTFQRFAAADTSMVLAIAPAWRKGCHAARIAFELPVA
jgi:hypothetical protein